MFVAECRLKRSPRRSFLRALGASVPLSLLAACRLPPWLGHTPLSRSTPTLVLMAAYLGAPSAGSTEPSWVAPVRAAVTRLSGQELVPGQRANLTMRVFKGDQAPGAFTRDGAGKITRIDYGSFFAGLASAGRAEADLLIVEAGAFMQATAWLDHYQAVGGLDAHLARERGTQPAYLPGTMALGQVNGRQIALPFVITPWLMRVDTVLFRTAGLAPPPPDQPWTWQQIIDLAPKLAQPDPSTGLNACWTCHAVTLPREVPIWQMGGDVVNASRAVVVDQPAAVRGVTFWRDLATRFGLDALPSAGGMHTGGMPKHRTYAIPTFGGGLAATTFDSLPWPSDLIAQHWDDGLAYAPVPFGTPGGVTAVTKLELQAVSGLSAGSRQPELAYAALRAIEATTGPALRLSAVHASAEQFLRTGGLDPRFAVALRWGIAAGQASVADALLGGTDVGTALARTVPGLGPVTK